MKQASLPKSTKKWWKEAVIYQIYPLSFKDSNGDGIGDINGIREKLDYLHHLGVDVLWLSPIFSSPNDDNGYDVSDYYGIMKEMGTMSDFDALLEEVHQRGMKLILDLVVNHSSDEHPWFLASKSSLDNPKRDWYIWRDGKEGGPPNNWKSSFEGSAWEYDATTQQYYLHLFSKKQPDLNWRNLEVKKAVWDIMHFWLKKGVDGFRMDVINRILKHPAFPDVPVQEATKQLPFQPAGIYYYNQPGIHELFQEMHQEVLQHYDCMSIGECSGITPEIGYLYTADHRQELNLTFQFEQLKSKTIPELKQVIKKWYDVFKEGSWNTTTLNNHDKPRQVSVFGDDTHFREESAKLLAVFLLTAPGTPFLYQGEELGMTNVYFPSIDMYNDIETRNRYQTHLLLGKTPEQAFNIVSEESRDNARTPMQWDNSPHAGFTSGIPWLHINPNFIEINAKAALENKTSVYYFYQQLITFRKKHDALIYGEYLPVDTGIDNLFAYQRIGAEASFFVILNFSSQAITYTILLSAAVLSNYMHQKEGVLQPWEASIWEI